MTNYTICVPDIGGAEGAEVVELLVAVGDEIELEQSVIVLESDKASMEIPASQSGVVKELRVAVGDELSEGDAILILELDVEEPSLSGDPNTSDSMGEEAEAISSEASSDAALTQEATQAQVVSEVTISVPDIGTDGDVEVVEVPAAVGDV